MTGDGSSSLVLGRDGRYRCRACDAVVSPGSAHCLICHAALDWPNASGASGASPMRALGPSLVAEARCPRGHGSLTHLELAGGHFHVCASCAGIFVENGTVNAAFDGGPLTSALIERATKLDAERTVQVDGTRVTYLSCPACAMSMARRNFERVSGIMVDACAKHGTWFDGGEVVRVSAFLGSGGLDKKERFEAREAETLEREREKIKLINEKIKARERGRKL